MNANDSTRSDYVSAGYYLVLLSERPEYISSALMPERLLSASPDICDSFPDCWVIEWSTVKEEERVAKAEKFGISRAGLPRVVEWATRAFSEEFGWPNVFYSLDAARNARVMFFSLLNEVILFGLGIHKSHAAKFLDAAKPPPQQPGLAPEGETGVFEVVSRGEMLAGGGISLGYELLVTQSGMLTCSWLCNGLERTFADSLDVKPNAHGFIETLEEASRCAQYISQGQVGAEPGLWLPWLVTKYGE